LLILNYDKKGVAGLPSGSRRHAGAVAYLKKKLFASDGAVAKWQGTHPDIHP
jgi:hypothetical protein